MRELPHVSPLPNISTLAILISPRKSPQIAKHGVPKKKFPRVTRTKGFCGNSTENPDFPGISRPIPISDFGVPIFSVLGGNEVDMLGSAAALTHVCMVHTHALSQLKTDVARPFLHGKPHGVLGRRCRITAALAILESVLRSRPINWASPVLPLVALNRRF